MEIVFVFFPSCLSTVVAVAVHVRVVAVVECAENKENLAHTLTPTFKTSFFPTSVSLSLSHAHTHTNIPTPSLSLLIMRCNAATIVSNLKNVEVLRLKTL